MDKLKILEGRIAIRDHLLAQIFEAVYGKGTGQAYLEGLDEADQQLVDALKARLGDG